MAENASLKQKVTTLLDNVKYYWKEPPKGRYMSFKEIGAYAFGGIGAYLIVCMSIPCILGATNVFLWNYRYRSYRYVYYVCYRCIGRYSFNGCSC